jgi:hypothetical protein
MNRLLQEAKQRAESKEQTYAARAAKMAEYDQAHEELDRQMRNCGSPVYEGPSLQELRAQKLALFELEEAELGAPEWQSEPQPLIRSEDSVRMYGSGASEEPEDTNPRISPDNFIPVVRITTEGGE